MGPLLPSYNLGSLHSAEIHRARTPTLLARRKISGRPYGHESDRSIAMNLVISWNHSRMPRDIFVIAIVASP